MSESQFKSRRKRNNDCLKKTPLIAYYKSAEL